MEFMLIGEVKIERIIKKILNKIRHRWLGLFIKS